MSVIAVFDESALDSTNGAGVQLHRGSTLVCIRQTSVLVCGLALFLTPAPFFGKVLKYHRRFPFDADLVRGGRYCGAILVDLESDDFFEGLEVRKTQAGPQFLKGSQAVELFPRELTVIVRVVTSRCVGPPDPHQFKPDFSFDMNFISSLRFEGFWQQRDFERRNLDLGLFSSVNRAGTASKMIEARAHGSMS